LSSLVQKSLLRKQDLKTFDDTAESAVVLTRALLLQLISDIERDGARPIIFIIPQKSIQSNFPLGRDVVVDHGAILIDGKEFLGVNDYYVIDSHWNAEGHKKAARALAAIVGNRGE